MQLNISKIEERIQKLQEIKRIASDPELVSMLLEFIVYDDGWKETAAPAKNRTMPPPSQADIDIVEQVMTGVEPTNGPRTAKRG